MKISKVWVSDFLEQFDLNPEEVAERLSSTLAEVEGIEFRGQWLDEKIVIGKIVRLVPHPNADRLKLAQVKIGAKILAIVCGADNIAEGQIVPVVLVGGRVKTPQGELVKVRKAKIRGVESEGMMCSQLELGVGEDHTGIWILPQEWEKYLGRPLAEVLPEIKDIVWEIENKALTHRPDCFGQLGLAREVAAAFGLKFKLPQWYQENWRPSQLSEKVGLKVKVEDPSLCSRYSAIVIEGVKIGPSPLWLQQRLISVGLRPINNVVDVTNYVMVELGQPMHAFDAEKLNGSQIVVRRAKKGEAIETLDGEIRELSEEDLVIADAREPVGVAGIIGGANSEIDVQTRMVILESANFNRANIRRSSMRLGVRTEASLRFEKGLDPNLTLPALSRAANLILEFCPEARITSRLIDFYPQPVKSKIVSAEPKFINRILGTKIKASKMIKILNSLGLKSKLSQGKLVVKVPTFRRDIGIPEDLVEEVGRIYGYDRLPLVLPQKDLTPVPVAKDSLLAKKIKQVLVALGFDEIYTYAFVGTELYRKCRLDPENLIPLKNPLSPELAFLKDSLVPTLIEKAALNLPNFDQFALFELARVFLYQKDKKQLPLQPKRVAGVVVRANGNNDEIFLVTKGFLEELLERILVPEINFKKPLLPVPYLHPSKSVEIYSGKKKIGVLGAIHPLVANEFSLDQVATALFEIDFELLKELVGRQINYSPPIKEALVKLDLAVKAESWLKAEEKIAQIFGKFLVRSKLVDHYQNKYTVRLWLLPRKETTGENLQKLIDRATG